MWHVCCFKLQALSSSNLRPEDAPRLVIAALQRLQATMTQRALGKLRAPAPPKAGNGGKSVTQDTQVWRYQHLDTKFTLVTTATLRLQWAPVAECFPLPSGEEEMKMAQEKIAELSQWPWRSFHWGQLQHYSQIDRYLSKGTEQAFRWPRIGTGECQSKIDRFGELMSHSMSLRFTESCWVNVGLKFCHLRGWCFCLCTGPDEWQLHSEDGYADVCVGGQGLMGAKLHRNAEMDSMGSRWMRMVEILWKKLSTMNSVGNLRKQLLDFLFLMSTLTRIELDIWNVWTHSCAGQTTLKWAGTSVPPRSPSCPAVAYAMPSGSQAVLGLALHVSWPTSSHWQRPLQPSALQGGCKLTCMNALYSLSCFWHLLTFWQGLNFTTCTVIWHAFFTCFIVCVIACLYILWYIYI